MIFLLMLFVFMLAIVVGNELISKVPPTLHTPLMSGANAISGITIVGALMCAQYVVEDANGKKILAVAAIALAMINVIGGFMVTDRMLAMFATKKKGGKK
jgi:NAD(P) transhydrogenase subunit alpha